MVPNFFTYWAKKDVNYLTSFHILPLYYKSIFNSNGFIYTSQKIPKLIKIISTIILLFVMQTANSQNDTVSNSRPKVGLVLSGGGAKGAAHIGVIKYIEEQGIPIDFIAGTSMGSVIGGMYALGYTSDEILDIVSQVDWDKLISDNVNRREISYTRKHESVTQLISVPFSVTTDREELQSRSFKNSLPTGIVSGDNLITLFNSLSVGYSDSIIFNDLPIPFICIATKKLVLKFLNHHIIQ